MMRQSGDSYSYPLHGGISPKFSHGSADLVLKTIRKTELRPARNSPYPRIIMLLLWGMGGS